MTSRMPISPRPDPEAARSSELSRDTGEQCSERLAYSRFLAAYRTRFHGNSALNRQPEAIFSDSNASVWATIGQKVPPNTAKHPPDSATIATARTK